MKITKNEIILNPFFYIYDKNLMKVKKNNTRINQIRIYVVSMSMETTGREVGNLES